MAGKSVNRRSLGISPTLLNVLKKIQGKIKAATGQEPSLTDLVDTMMLPNMSSLERQILNKSSGKEIIELKLDKDLG